MTGDFQNIDTSPVLVRPGLNLQIFPSGIAEYIPLDDDVIDFGNFKVLIDSMSYPYLYGSTLDFVEDLSGAKFVIENPNAKTTCGCGESFTV